MDFSKLSVVVADDQKSSREIVIHALRTMGIRQFYEAQDGGEAFEIIKQRDPDFVVIDLIMPHDGVRVLNAIRRSVESPRIDLPVIIMTALAERERILSLRDAGVNEVITKPLSIDKVCSRVSSVLKNPRRFIICDTYVGPCRRRALMQNYKGPLRRQTDASGEEFVLA